MYLRFEKVVRVLGVISIRTAVARSPAVSCCHMCQHRLYSKDTDNKSIEKQKPNPKRSADDDGKLIKVSRPSKHELSSHVRGDKSKLPAKWRWDEEQEMITDSAAEVAAGGEINYLAQETVIGNTDILIIGGGAVGLAAAFWIKHKNPRSMTVTLVEQNPEYETSSSVLGLGGLTQQYSIPEDILAARFSCDFFRNVHEFLAQHIEDTNPPVIDYEPQGCLKLVDEDTVPHFMESVNLQRKLGVKLDVMMADDLRVKFPWLNVEGIAMAGYGLLDEGWINPRKYMRALRTKTAALGVRHVHGTLSNFEMHDHIKHAPGVIKDKNRAMVQKSDGKMLPMEFAICINAAGSRAAEVSKLAGLEPTDFGGGFVVDFSLPVEQRKRYMFAVSCPDGPGLECPYVLDPSGLSLRREGVCGLYLVTYNPPAAGHTLEPNTLLLDVEDNYYEEVVRPLLVRRVPQFEHSRLEECWAHYIDYNTTPDKHMIVGQHPIYRGHIVAAGFNGSAVQFSPAVGRALMELIMFKGKYQALDFNRYGFMRISDHDSIDQIRDYHLHAADVLPPREDVMEQRN